MSKSGAILSNGELYVRLNSRSLVDKIYYPYLGNESHLHDAHHRIGIFVDNKISWLEDSDWDIKQEFLSGVLIVHTVAINNQLGILIEFDDFVCSENTVLIRNIHLVNLLKNSRDIKLFMHQAFYISDGRLPIDTAQFVPNSAAIMHYRGRRAFVAGGITDDGCAFDQLSVGRFGVQGLEGTWKDAEDGILSGCVNDTGNTDSIMRFSIKLAPYSSRRAQYWLTAGTSPRSALLLNEKLRAGGATTQFNKTASYHRRQLHSTFKIIDRIPSTSRQTFIDSLLLLKSHIDMHGAIMTKLSEPASCEIHDALYCLWPLMRLGYKDEALRFFNFCKQAMLPDNGYILPSYRTDGAWQESDRAWSNGIPPINISDVALLIFMFGQYNIMHPRSHLLNDFFKSLILPAANFIATYLDKKQDLILEESTYSLALCQAGLDSAAELAEKSNNQEYSVMWRTRAEYIRKISSSLYDDVNGFYKQSAADDNSLSVKAFFGAFMFGLSSKADDKIVRNAAALEVLKTDNGLYRENSSEERADFIASLWMAQYFMESGEVDKAKDIIQNVSQNISRTGFISARDGDSQGEPSVRASSEYINTLLDSIK